MIFFENTTNISPRCDYDEFDIISQYSSDDEMDDIKSKIQKLVKANSSSYKPPNFITIKRMNRGRKIDDNNLKMKGDNKCKRKTHTSNFIDNTLCKLQIHFLNFLVNFSNDAIRTAFENEQIYNQIIKKSEWLKNLLDMNYLNLFEKYYNQCNPIDSIHFEEKTIYLAKETKPFYNLYNKLKLEMKDKIIKIIKDLYLGQNKSSLKFIESTESK